MYTKDFRADYSLCDAEGCLSVRSIMEITQDASAACFGCMGCDNMTLKNKFDCMWVFLKYKAYFYKKVLWNEAFSVSTCVISFKKLKCTVETDFWDEKKEILARVFLECCVLDCKSHALRRIDSVSFPMDYVCPEGASYSFYGKNPDGMVPVASHKVQSQEIDFSRHMNNMAYITMILNTYRVDELLKMRITSMECHYDHETPEGAQLEIWKRKEEHMDSFCVKNEENEAFYMTLEYEVEE